MLNENAFVFMLFLDVFSYFSDMIAFFMVYLVIKMIMKLFEKLDGENIVRSLKV